MMKMSVSTSFSLILCLALVISGEYVQKAAGDGKGTKWAVLVAGSNGIPNYRHQADVCHAYQILKKGGLKDENIVVMMYDDIANNPLNPIKGYIFNRPYGENVYTGVPKDYTGKAVNANNLLAVIQGDKKGVKGGSGKVINSGPNDYIFMYYSGHGQPGILEIAPGPDLYATDLISTLKNKHTSRTYKKMVIYVEGCYSGSIFDGLLPKDMNIYVTTAANPGERSCATYCPVKEKDPRKPPPPLNTCLGDLYSVSWMEDSEQHMRTKETLQQQYEVVKTRTTRSHVMQYGDINIAHNDLTSLFIGQSSPASVGSIFLKPNITTQNPPPPPTCVDPDDADLLYLRRMVEQAPQGSRQQAEAQKELKEEIANRARVDSNILKIGEFLFPGSTPVKVKQILDAVRPAGQPLVDDWKCLKLMADAYNKRCGELSAYGKKYMRAFANICNAKVKQGQMEQALARTCTVH